MPQYCHLCGRQNDNQSKNCANCKAPLSMLESTVHESAAGTRELHLLNDRYEIIGIIKSGSMGSVYKAKDTLQNNIVAVKKMISAYSKPDERIYIEKRFKEEARILSMLNHNGLPKVTDFFIEYDSSSGKNAHYLAMTFINGKDLETIISERKNMPFSLDEVIDYSMQILHILKYLHSQKQPIIYRDLNPRNTMLENGRIFLVDFGIARMFTPRQKGTAIGTPGYASPEHYKGFAEPRSDFYSLGAVMHYLLTGQNPEDSSRALFSFEPPQKYNKTIPIHIDNLIMSMLDLNPESRPFSADDILQILDSHPADKKDSSKFNLSLSGITKTPLIKPSPEDRRINSCKSKYGNIFDAVNDTDPHAIKEFIADCADINIRNGDNQTPLHVVIWQGMKSLAPTVKSMIEKGADINAKDNEGWTPLHYAINRELTATAELLIKKGADLNAINKDGWTPLHYAINRELTAAAELLIRKGADLNAINKDGWTPLHCIVILGRRGLKATAELLIRKGADVNIRDKDGWTPLHYAVNEELTKMADLLINKGADINAMAKNGWTPLHYSVNKELKSMVLLLINNDADVNAKDKKGRTPLHHAAEKKLQKMADLLIKNNADINAKDNEGWTPLHIAVKNGHRRLSRLLVKSGADINAKNRSGATPFETAKEPSWWKRLLSDIISGYLS